ncbi:integral membrane protein 2B-like [Paramacrobiotus metropolitanus]|uniref:integral membrane protein 2B-like n=1 Tax=Paramacrobiotus metropolitanus TaxID=2943436 RepID=UPI00244626F4|nr:integral membrane protein 2B-like [Paramacrobiotus metropolitanus]
MTIVTKPLTDEKKDLKPLVVDSESAAFPVDPPPYAPDAESQITVYQHPYRKHRTGFLICLGLLIVLTIGCATMGGIYLYYRFSQPEGYRGTCRIRFNNPQFDFNAQPDDSIPSASFQSQPNSPLAADVVNPFQPARNRLLSTPTESGVNGDLDLDLRRIINSFQQDFELDLRRQMWEILQTPRVPQLGLNQPSRFIHDFSLNLTAIYDIQNSECYIMPLNRSVIKPPQDLFEFLRGMQDGSYTLDGSVIRQTYYVDPLPVMDYSVLGPFITRECLKFPTYWLIARDDADVSTNTDNTAEERVRRSAIADQVTSTFGEFVGSLHTVNIVKPKI